MRILIIHLFIICKILGPVAVNWMLSLTDPMAAQFHLELGTANLCPMYEEQGKD